MRRTLLLAAALPASLAAMLVVPPLVRAQGPSLAEQQGRLADARAAAESADARAQALDRQAAGERNQALQARAQEAAAAQRVRAAEAQIAAAGARIAIIDRLLRTQRARLAEKQGAVLHLVAALQAMARRPAVLGVVQPGSTADIVHVRAVLGTTLPVIAARTASVRAELDRTRQLRSQGQLAVRTLREGRTRLEQERIALVRLEAAHRLRSRSLTRGALFESDRAIALGERARDIVDAMETAGAEEDTRRALASLPGPLPRPADAETASVPIGKRPPPYRLPVDGGRLVTGLGELSDTGVRARGLTFAAQSGTPVVAPAAGRVLFARRFRDYGNVLILDHGKGWTSMIDGVGSLRVKPGQQVVQGQPLGRVPPGAEPHVTVELRRRDQPIDITPLLR